MSETLQQAPKAYSIYGARSLTLTVFYFHGAHPLAIRPFYCPRADGAMTPALLLYRGQPGNGGLSSARTAPFSTSQMTFSL